MRVSRSACDSEPSFPILPPVQEADDQHAHVIQQVHDDVRLIGMQADGRVEFGSFAGDARIGRDQVERRRQPLNDTARLGAGRTLGIPKGRCR